MKKSVNELSCVVKDFLEQAWDGKSPLLVAYSGGPDSKALLYASLEWGKAPVHVAHADHGWRKESGAEAELLRAEVETLRIPFHSIRLEPSQSENEARDLRYRYFRDLREKVPYLAVLLGHQADDLAETVLKRVFEGAHLTSLAGMRSISLLDGLVLWRPLLSVSRAVIEAWLKERSLDCFRDSSNEDPRYLRARMRSELLPFLNEKFGKNISANLLALSERSFELQQYFQEQNRGVAVENELGVWVQGSSLPRVRLRALLQECLKKEKIILTRSVLEDLLDWIEQKKIDCRPLKQIIIHQGSFYLLKKKFLNMTISEVKKSFLCIEGKEEPNPLRKAPKMF